MKKHWIGGSLFFMAVAWVGCQSSPTEAPSTEKAEAESPGLTLSPEQETTGGIKTGEVESRAFVKTFQVKGKVEIPPQNRVSLSPPLGGYLHSTPLLPGMRVKKGQPVAVLEDKTYIEIQEQYRAAQGKLAWLQTDYQRQKELLESNSVSEKVFQEVQYQLSQQKILVQSLAEKLRLAGLDPQKNGEISRFLTLRAPVSGIVSEIHVNIGKYVQPTEVLFDFIDPSDTHLSLQVFEQDLEKLYVGQRFRAFTNTQPDRIFTGEVLIISPVYSENKTVNVQCHFDKYAHVMIPGTYMNVSLAQPPRSSFSLPKEAVVQRGSQNWIYQEIQPHTYRRVLVEIGEEKDGWVPLTFPSEIDPKKTKWVTSGAYALYMMEENTD